MVTTETTTNGPRTKLVTRGRCSVLLCACVRVRSEHTHLGPSGLIFQNKKTHLPVGVGPAQNLTSVDSRVYFFVASFYLSRIT